MTVRVQTSPTLRKEHVVRDAGDQKLALIRANSKLRTRILVQEHTGSPLSQNLGDILRQAGL
jgi:hypothetical protein